MSDSTTPLKRCTQCGSEFPETTEYFNKHKEGRNGLRPNCRICSTANAKKYHSTRREQDREDSKRWRADHPDYGRLVYARKPDYFKTRQRNRRIKSPESVRAYDRKRYSLNADTFRSRIRLMRARRKNAGGKHTGADVKKQYALQRGRCYWCGEMVADRYHVDHIIPLAKGGDNSPRNICISCPECNLSKGAKMPHEFSGRLF
jgi:5-methylcytosine-specific restriction endonuclease McrA